MYNQDDTIAAIVTPIGVGGISVLRLSGKQALTVAARGFRHKEALTEVKTHTAHFGRFVNTKGDVIDEVVVTVFREPNSYTGEDVVEISCHGSMYITQKILDSLVEFGARLAQPGEFTKRAFLNRKIDLSQAEAVADLIQSRTILSHKASLAQLEGKLSNSINVLRKKLIEICGLIELELDFVEEGLEFTEEYKVNKEVENITNAISQLIATYEFGRICREGVKVVIVGKPNVGKSSLLNALLDQDRAIVTDVSGTTRDTIEENITINGLLFRLVDTAGLRDTPDFVEKEGIVRTEKQIESSDIVLFMVDGYDGFTGEDERSFDKAVNCVKPHSKVVVGVNKIDLVGETLQIRLPERLSRYPTSKFSAKTGEGLDNLKNHLYSTAFSEELNVDEKSVILTNLRHKQALQKSLECLSSVQRGLTMKAGNELIALDFRRAINHLGEIIGAVTTDDILNSIFSRFCVGK